MLLKLTLSLVFRTSFQRCLTLFFKGVKHSCLKVFNTVDQGCLTPLKLSIISELLLKLLHIISVFSTRSLQKNITTVED